jgi:hypothetical protein
MAEMLFERDVALEGESISFAKPVILGPCHLALAVQHQTTCNLARRSNEFALPRELERL